MNIPAIPRADVFDPDQVCEANLVELRAFCRQLSCAIEQGEAVLASFNSDAAAIEASNQATAAKLLSIQLEMARLQGHIDCLKESR